MSVWSSRKVRYTAAFAGVTAIAVPAGIGLATTNSVASPPDASDQVAVEIAKAKSHIQKLPDSLLLNPSQLGKGWSTFKLDTIEKLAGKTGVIKPGKIKKLLGQITVSPAECAGLLSLPHLDSVNGLALRTFKKKGSMLGPYAASAVVRFKSPAAAGKALKEAGERAAACSTVTVGTKYGDVNGTVTPLSLPKLGKGRVGYTIDASVAGFVSVKAQVAAVRKGKWIVVVGQGGTTAKASLTKSMARKAVAKL